MIWKKVLVQYLDFKTLYTLEVNILFWIHSFPCIKVRDKLRSV